MNAYRCDWNIPFGVMSPIGWNQLKCWCCFNKMSHNTNKAESLNQNCFGSWLDFHEELERKRKNLLKRRNWRSSWRLKTNKHHTRNWAYSWPNFKIRISSNDSFFISNFYSYWCAFFHWMRLALGLIYSLTVRCVLFI